MSKTTFVRVKTELPLPAEVAFAWAHEFETFQFVVSPIIGFYPAKEQLALANSGDFIVGMTLSARLWFLKIVPAWKHAITIVADADFELYTNESSGPLVGTWNHRLTFIPTGDQSCSYTDEIEIDDNLLSGPTKLFVRNFFRYRQRRWHRLIRERQHRESPAPRS